MTTPVAQEILDLVNTRLHDVGAVAGAYEDAEDKAKAQYAFAHINAVREGILGICAEHGIFS